jgi:hypothetical protein
MHNSYTGLYVGIAFSMLLVYLLMVVNFQSWTQPFIIITALPCALTGIIWMLFATGTTLSVPALMGAIMCMGVATANSVLVVTFADELLERYKDPYRAALGRLCPDSTGTDDRAGHDHWNGANGVGSRRRWRAKRSLRPRGDRWFDLG